MTVTRRIPRQHDSLIHEEAADIRMEKEDNNNNKGEIVVVDALPYVDAIHEDYEQYALALIEDEMKRIGNPPPQQQQEEEKDLPDTSIPRFRTRLMEEEYNRRFLSRGGGGEGYEAVASNNNTDLLFSPVSKLPDDENNIEEWKNCIKRARIAYESERIRSIQLEIEKGDAGRSGDGDGDGGCSSADLWKQYINLINQMKVSYKTRLDEQQQKVDEMNAIRQQHQKSIGDRLTILSNQREELIQKQFRLKQAIADLDDELK